MSTTIGDCRIIHRDGHVTIETIDGRIVAQLDGPASSVWLTVLDGEIAILASAGAVQRGPDTEPAPGPITDEETVEP